MSKRKKRNQSAPSPKQKPITRRVLLIAAVSILSAVAGYYVISRPETADIRIGDSLINVEIADTPELRGKGLSGRKRLKTGQGMVFVFEFSRRQNFCMKDTSIPLSLAFISLEGVIFQIEQMTPYDLRLVTSRSPAPYALEVNQGFFKENGITVGTQVDLSNVINR